MAPFEASTVGDALELHELKGLVLGDPEAARFRTAQGTVQLDGPLLQSIKDQTLAPMQFARSSGFHPLS